MQNEQNESGWTVETLGTPASWDAFVGIFGSEAEARDGAEAYWHYLTPSERDEVGGIVITHGDVEIAWPSSAQEVRESCPSEAVQNEGGNGVTWIYSCPGGWFVDDVPEFDNGLESVQDVLMDHGTAYNTAGQGA